MKLNIFIPHRWNNLDYYIIRELLDKTKFNIRDYSVPALSSFDNIDRRYNVDPQIQKQIKYAHVVICSNRPANNTGMSLDEVCFAISIGKPVIAIRVTDNTSKYISKLGIDVIPKRKDSIESWINKNVI